MKDNIGGEKMIIKKTYSYWSVFLSIVGFLLLIATYLFSPSDPQGMIVLGLKIMFVAAIILLALGIISSTIAIKKKEDGIKKYVGVLLPVLIILSVILYPILMAIGFMINDNP